jgi:hypothetical protein
MQCGGSREQMSKALISWIPGRASFSLRLIRLRRTVTFLCSF